MWKLVTVMVVLMALAVSSTASAASRDPRVPALQRQVASLRGQVATLTATVNSLKGVVSRDEDVSVCLWTKQGHFNHSVINVFEVLAGLPQSADNTPSDNGACARIGVQPMRRTAGLSPFGTALLWDSEVAAILR